MKKLLISAAFPVLLVLHLGFKVFFSGMYAYDAPQPALPVVDALAYHPAQTPLNDIRSSEAVFLSGAWIAANEEAPALPVAADALPVATPTPSGLPSGD